MTGSSKTPLLDTVYEPSDIRSLRVEQLRQLADEVRLELIEVVSRTGGHLGAGLGVVELTVALHYVFNTPEDRLVWDVGHQAYPHKILTGRRDRIHTLRQSNGLSGFTKRSESPYDPFGAGHSSTSISAGLGMAVARSLYGHNHSVVCVIGDGAMSAGQAYEAMNNTGSGSYRLIVILNDNDMSIAPPVGAMSNYLSRVVSSRSFRSVRYIAKKIVTRLPMLLERVARRADEYIRGLITGGTLFEELGFYYVGPVDGHCLNALIPVLKNVRDNRDSKSVLVHVVTQKGHGYKPAEQAPDKYHGVSKFDITTGAQAKPQNKIPNYTSVFAHALLSEAEQDEKIVAITAAMPAGTGLDHFAQRFPTRCFDVGIAEQHAVTFAAGLASEGFKPFATIYSTFLQRGYDQVIHDVALQKLPVRFAIDRAGLVGADGPTHHGAFDLVYLCCLPSFVVMAPSDERELVHMVTTAVAINDRPSAVRYPRGEGTGVTLPVKGEALPIGRGRVIREGSMVALLSLGTRLADCLGAADKLIELGISTTVADARFAKPLDVELIQDLASSHAVLITVEEGAAGGFGAHVMHSLAKLGQLDHGLKMRTLTLPDVFLEHGMPSDQLSTATLTTPHIVTTVLVALNRKKD